MGRNLSIAPRDFKFGLALSFRCPAQRPAFGPRQAGYSMSRYFAKNRIQPLLLGVIAFGLFSQPADQPSAWTAALAGRVGAQAGAVIDAVVRTVFVAGFS